MRELDSDLTGRMLVAMPGMTDPRFVKSVIFLCAHSDQGAMGLIVNKPAPDMRLSDLLAQLKLTPSDRMRNLRVHVGGPVEHARGFVLHSADHDGGASSMKIDDRTAMTATVDVLERLAAGEGPRQALVALGYAGWGPGQLEAELARHDWLTCPARDDIVFGRADDHKWTAALRSIGVDPVTLSSTGGRA